MRRHPLLLGLAALLAFVLAACGQQTSPLAPFDDRKATGQELFGAYTDLLVARDQQGLEALLGEAFLVQRADGSWQDRASFLARLPQLRSATFGNTVEERSADTLTARMDVTADITIDGQVYPTGPAPMLVSFSWRDGRWQLDAQANFLDPTARDASTDPSATPSQDPTATPSATPSQDPTATPSTTPSQDPTAGPSPRSSASPSAGSSPAGDR